ncbi:fructose 1,6-bisphosphatase [Dokdonia sp.]|uniref:fructose 1,6-bisphosphatase n=1 Tax=Dokdonia sp. TaxID=2024995 RepID=UPI0032669904
MSKEKKEQVVKKELEANSKIDAIKQLIFGENMAEYSQEFDTLKKELENRRRELSDYIDDTRKELMTAIDNLSTDVNIRISDLEESLNDKTTSLDEKKVDKSQLGNLLIKLGESIKA